MNLWQRRQGYYTVTHGGVEAASTSGNGRPEQADTISANVSVARIDQPVEEFDLSRRVPGDRLHRPIQVAGEKARIRPSHREVFGLRHFVHPHPETLVNVATVCGRSSVELAGSLSGLPRMNVPG